MSVTDDKGYYQPVNRRSEIIQLPMNSSTSQPYTSNPSLADQQEQNHVHQTSPQRLPNDEETATYSFRHVTKKLQHAKSHGELYQPAAPLPLPSMTNKPNDENELKYQQRLLSESPQTSTSMRTRAATTTTVVPASTRSKVNSNDETNNSSSSNKMPLWKRFKKMIVPSKRSKDSSSNKIPNLHLNELSINETSKTFFKP